jgi:hypothetical protein
MGNTGCSRVSGRFALGEAAMSKYVREDGIDVNGTDTYNMVCGILRHFAAYNYDCN